MTKVSEKWSFFTSYELLYIEYYFENLYHLRLFSPLNNNIEPNVAKRQSEWSEKGFQRKMTAASLSVSASQALIALSEHSTESSQPNFSRQCAASVVFVFTGETESVYVSVRERERQTGRDRYSVMSFHKALCVLSLSWFYEFIINEWVNVTAEGNRTRCSFRNERQKSKKMKRGKKEIVRAPVMIQLIIKAMAGVVHVCCLYSGTHRDCVSK